MTHTYIISGMTCGKCVARVKTALLKLGDVVSAEIQLDAPQANITMAKHLSVAILQDAIHKAGPYTITPAGDEKMEMQAEDNTQKNSYFPIFLIFGYIAGISILIQAAQGSFHWMQWMSHFMAGFFLVFSFFKLLNLAGFAEGYRTYDIVAKYIPVWGFIYPFIELGLGLAFMTGFNPLGINIAALIIMSLSSIGVIKSLLRKGVFQCACLGTVIKLPLSQVTLFEDLLMVTMSAIMIISL